MIRLLWEGGLRPIAAATTRSRTPASTRCPRSRRRSWSRPPARNPSTWRPASATASSAPRRSPSRSSASAPAAGPASRPTVSCTSAGPRARRRRGGPRWSGGPTARSAAATSSSCPCPPTSKRRPSWSPRRRSPRASSAAPTPSATSPRSASTSTPATTTSTCTRSAPTRTASSTSTSGSPAGASLVDQLQHLAVAGRQLDRLTGERKRSSTFGSMYEPPADGRSVAEPLGDVLPPPRGSPARRRLLELGGSIAASSAAASTVPCQVRKSLAENCSPTFSWMYSLISSERTSCQPSRAPVGDQVLGAPVMPSRHCFDRLPAPARSRIDWTRRCPLFAGKSKITSPVAPPRRARAAAWRRRSSRWFPRRARRRS